MKPAPALTNNLTPSDLDRLHRFRIPDDLIELHEVHRVSDPEARECGIHYRGNLAGVLFPIFGADGNIKAFRLRRDNPEIEDGKPKAKYVQSVDLPHLYFERSSRQFLSDLSVPILFVEAYSSALAVAAWCQRTQQRYLIIATAGCWGWRGRVGKLVNENGVRIDEKGPSPDLNHINFANQRKALVCFDANVASNSDVQRAEHEFQRELERRGAAVPCARIPEESSVNGPDDYLAIHTDEEFLQILDSGAVDPWPEPQPIEASLRPVDSLPLELIPPPLQDWAVDVSQRMGCPLEFIAAAAIVAISSVIGAGCGIRPKKHDDWFVVPNVWGGVVGRPSMMLKTPALQEATRPLERLAADANESHDAAMKAHDADLAMYNAEKHAVESRMKAAVSGKTKNGKRGDAAIDTLAVKAAYAALTAPPAPKRRRFKTNDATVEKLSEILADNSRGVLIFRDELIGLLSSWDREGRESDRAFFLETWNGTAPSYEVDRIGRGSIRVDNPCLSILGGIQPAKLTSYLYAAMRGNDNDGLVQRLQLLVYPDEPKPSPIVDRCPNSEAKARAYAIFKKLADMNFLECGACVPDQYGRIPYFHFDQQAQPAFYEWFDDLSQKLRADDEPIVIEHLGKYRSLMPSLALIFHLIDIADGAAPGPIPIKTATRAMDWCEFLASALGRSDPVVFC